MLLFLLASRFQFCHMHETYCLLFKHHKRSAQPWKSCMFGHLHVIYLHDCGKSMSNISLFSYPMFSFSSLFVLNISCSRFFVFNTRTILRYCLALFTALLTSNLDLLRMLGMNWKAKNTNCLKSSKIPNEAW